MAHVDCNDIDVYTYICIGVQIWNLHLGLIAFKLSVEEVLKLIQLRVSTNWGLILGSLDEGS